MAKRFVKVSLATKLRLLFGAAVLGIIAAALLVPWYFMELLAEQGVQRPAVELTRLRLNEWIMDHPRGPGAASKVAAAYSQPHGEQPGIRQGPRLVRLGADLSAAEPLDAAGQSALAAFVAHGQQELAILPGAGERNVRTFRCYRAVRADAECIGCHGPQSGKAAALQFRPGQLVGIIEVEVPAQVQSPLRLVSWTRYAFVVGGALAALFAFVVFAVLTQRLILRPVRRLRDVADKVAEGDLSVRSTIRTGDELQRLGESFNEMLAAISEQHNRLRAANRALDIKLNELAEANVTLFQANTVKSEFLANVSHELRTPLNSILGFAELIAESPDEKQRRYGQNIRIAARGLLNMINDILDLAKIEAGKAEVRLDRVSVSDTCQTLLALIGPLAEKKHLALEGEIDPALPIVTTDAGKLQQILYNLLSNAVKFTPPGGQITLSAKQAGQAEVAVAVADTGPGIAESEQERIFEKFYQLDRTLTKGSAGAGLGLAIAKELASLLGGRLTLLSEAGHGTTFTLTLPLEPLTRASNPPA